MNHDQLEQVIPTIWISPFARQRMTCHNLIADLLDAYPVVPTCYLCEKLEAFLQSRVGLVGG